MDDVDLWGRAKPKTRSRHAMRSQSWTAVGPPPGSRLVSDPCLAPGSLSSLQAGVVRATPSAHPRLMSLSLRPCGDGLHVSSQTRLHLRLDRQCRWRHTASCRGYSGTETGTAEAADRDSARLNGTRHSAPPNGRCIRRRQTSRACGRTGYTVEDHSMLQSVEKSQLPKPRQCQEPFEDAVPMREDGNVSRLLGVLQSRDARLIAKLRMWLGLVMTDGLASWDPFPRN